MTKEVEFVRTPDFSRVKLIYLRLGKAIQKSILKSDKTEKKNHRQNSFKVESYNYGGLSVS